eukprot:3910046-Pleurochrysis_carterae.AAC.1
MSVRTLVKRLAFGAQHRSSPHQNSASNTRSTGLSPARFPYHSPPCVQEGRLTRMDQALMGRSAHATRTQSGVNARSR